MRYAGIGLVLMAFLVGCGGGGSHESIARESVGVIDEMATALENSKTADEAKPKLEKSAAKFKDLKKRMDALPKLSKTEEENMQKKLQPEMDKAGKKLASAMMQFAQRDPAGFQQIQGVLQESMSGLK
jgi:hypothetical protein